MVDEDTIESNGRFCQTSAKVWLILGEGNSQDLDQNNATPITRELKTVGFRIHDSSAAQRVKILQYCCSDAVTSSSPATATGARQLFHERDGTLRKPDFPGGQIAWKESRLSRGGQGARRVLLDSVLSVTMSSKRISTAGVGGVITTSGIEVVRTNGCTCFRARRRSASFLKSFML